MVKVLILLNAKHRKTYKEKPKPDREGNNKNAKHKTKAEHYSRP